MRSAFLKKIKGSVILITGGTGSFGNTVVSQLLTLQPKKIIIFSRDEKKHGRLVNKKSFYYVFKIIIKNFRFICKM